MSIDLYEIGREYRINYPAIRLVGYPPAFQPRIVVVRKIRDLLTNPLTAQEFLKRPLLRRGRWLLRCTDQHKRGFRQFYVDSTKQHWRDCPLRIGWYDLAEPVSRPVKIYSRSFSSVHDRRVLTRVIANLSRCTFDGLSLRVFCDDLRIVG